MKPFLNKVGGKSISDVITMQGGLNTCYDKTFIEDNQMSYMWNVALLNPPTLSVRNSRTSLAWFLEDTTDFATGKVQKLFSSSSKILYTIEDRRTPQNPEAESQLHRYVYNSNGRLDKVYLGSIPYEQNYSMCECRDAENVYIVISTPLNKYIYTEGKELKPATDKNTGIITCHKNRLWVANGTSLKFSNLREYDNFEITESDPINTAGEINITNSRGNIVALIPYDGKLIIFCERSWHILYGDSPNAEVNQFTLVDTDDGIGCISQNTVNICDRNLYWMDTDTKVYRYNGSYITRVSEPHGGDNYASYGGIKDIGIHMPALKKIRMASYDSYLYIIVQRSPLTDAENDTALVYDTRNRVWWAEDGEFVEIARHDVDTTTRAFSRSDFLIGAKYNGDIVIMNTQPTGQDMLFDIVNRGFHYVDVKYGFETKTWVLGTVKHKKTLTNVWLQADAEAKVYVSDHWTNIEPWQEQGLEKEYILIGESKRATTHQMDNPNSNYHEGSERQRFIVPRMYMQKVNAMAIRIIGEGDAKFFLLEKEWRIK